MTTDIRRPVRKGALCAGLVLAATASVMVSTTGSVAVAATAQQYYVDCAAGDDASSGKSTLRPWRTLSRVNSQVFLPGDVVRFRRGTTCTGTLAPKGSGVPGTPIVLNSYGTGAKPVIDGQGQRAAVLLHNVEHWEVRDLEVTNTGPASTTAQRVGVYVLLEDYGIGKHYVVSNVTVRDVNGCDCRYPTPSGGIVFEAGGSSVPTGFDRISVRQNTVTHVDRIGIGTFSSWQRRAENPTGPGSTFVPMTNVVVARNTVTDAGGDGIVILNGMEAQVQYNVVDRFNTRSADFNIGAYAWNSNHTVFQYNDVSHGFGVGIAFGIEGGNIGTVYQYNFSRSNGGGFMYLCNSDGSTSRDGVVRYNVSQDDTGAPPYLGMFTMTCGDIPNTRIYNNTFHAPTSGLLVANYGTTKLLFTNNIFVGQAGSAVSDPHGSYDHNLFHNVATLPPNNLQAQSGDPQFVAPGTASSRNTADGYRLLTGSPALGTGTVVPDSGTVDYFGNPVPVGSSNIGAYQGPGV
ncbi:MAG TPA: right-handed parallel beta-helix repeat-containing protein [Micromonosporaceae bacterium]|nr:right-handed parallel beta-helix repeat-containing protein [Micromonosporaceae bacterium]